LLNVEEPNELRIRSVISDIVNRISMTSENVVRSIQHHDSRNHQVLESLHDRMKDFFAERFSVTLHGSAAPPSDIVALSQLTLRSSYENNVASSQLSSQSSYEVGSSLNDLQRSEAASYEGTSDAQASQASSSLNPDAVPSEHHMCRTVSTVSDL